MNPPKCDDLTYIHFLIAAQKVFTYTEDANPKSKGQKPTTPLRACCEDRDEGV